MNSIIITLLIFICSTTFLHSRVLGQGATGWMAPVNLTRGILNSNGDQADSFAPVMVADSKNGIHAFWATRINPEIASIGDTIYYSYWDGTNWSAPLDILFSPSDIFWLPQAVIDQNDNIHLAWISSQSVWYSQVYAGEAMNVRAWSTPIRISEGGVRNLATAVSPNGTINVSFSTYSSEKQQVFYIHSDDGQDWSIPVKLWEGNIRVNFVVPRIAVDNTGRAHVVIGEGGSGTAVYYLQSADDGVSWSYPKTVDSQDDRFTYGYGPAYITVFTKGNDEVHLVWDGAPAGQRWHQWSDDGGATWKVPVQLSSEVRGLTGTNSVAVDQMGRIHLFTLGITGTAPYYATWWNGSWSALDPIAGQGWDGEGPALVVAGNRLVVSWWTRSQGTVSVWASMRRIDISSASPEIQETARPGVLPSLTHTPQRPEKTDTPEQFTPTLPFSQETLTNDNGQAHSTPAPKILLIGILPVVFLLIGVVVYTSRTRRKF